MTPADAGGRRVMLWGALALFVAAPATAVALTAFNLVRSSEIDARAAAQETVLRQIEQRVRYGTTAAGGGDVSTLRLRAQSSTLAKAELQQLVVRMVDRASARLVETRAGDNEAEQDDKRRVELRVTLDATNESLFELLYALETGVPLLTVEQIGIRNLPSRTGTPETNPMLRATLLIRGHWSGTEK